MDKKNKYYVVWNGRKKGVFFSWNDCKSSIDGYNNARYKAFDSFDDAKRAFSESYEKYISYTKPSGSSKTGNLSGIYTKDAEKIRRYNSNNELLNNQLPIHDSLCVDAACSGNPGVMEYRGVHILTGKQIFYYKHPYGTNNIGEFLALVHGLSYLKRNNLKQPLYSDSVNAIKWVAQKKCKTKLPVTKKTEDLFEYIHRAEKWLQSNSYTTEIIKWDTDHWGEIPADFGRKS